MVPRINSQNTVVVILCKDRLKYLFYTWQSLQKTSDLPVFVYDDGSTSPDIIKFLTTNSEFPVHIDINNNVLEKNIGYFPPISSITGINSRIQLFRQKKSIGNTAISLKMVREIFSNTSFQYIIRLEDDVVFKKDWVQTLMEKWNNWNIPNKGILCSCAVQNHFRKKTSSITTHHNPTFQCVVIPRYFYELDRDYFDEAKRFETKIDLYFRKHCLELELECGLLPESVCQHIGIESLEISKNIQNGPYFSSDYDFSRRLDLSVEGPFIY